MIENAKKTREDFYKELEVLQNRFKSIETELNSKKINDISEVNELLMVSGDIGKYYSNFINLLADDIK